MSLSFDDGMRERLRQRRELQLADLETSGLSDVAEFLLVSERVCLWCGYGHASFVDLEGRVFYWNYSEGSPVEEFTGALEIASVLRHGAETGLTEVLNFLPACPTTGVTCRQCRGTRWMHPASRTRRDAGRQVCVRCHGLGWTDP